MKKIKKVLAMSTATAMVFGMAMTTYAAPVTDITSDITITGLASNAVTTVNGYQFASLDYDEETNVYSWIIDKWAEPYVELNSEGTVYEIKTGQETAFKNAAMQETADLTETDSLDTTQVVFVDAEIGGYVFVPSDDVAEYDLLFVVNTYDRVNSPSDAGKPVAVDVTAVAKMETHTITKEQNDDFVQIGETVDYTVKTTFPVSEDSEGNKLTKFVVTDTPTGLDIDASSVKVTIGGDSVTLPVDAVSVDDDGVLTVNFANELSKGHDGKEVVITYTATVTATEFNNSVNADSNVTDYDGDETTGENGSITITKVDAENTATKLLGVEFQIYDLGVDGQWDAEDPGTPMSLIYDTTLNAYRPALDGENGVTTIIDGTNGDGTADGIIKVDGLAEGNYHFVETKAPNGYSINEAGLTVTIDPDADAPVIDIEANFLDTKLSSLPSTGGIGTTIFTIGGIVIMVAAAGLYFANRRKNNAE